jgi:hypothetical protein
MSSWDSVLAESTERYGLRRSLGWRWKEAGALYNKYDIKPSAAVGRLLKGIECNFLLLTV